MKRLWTSIVLVSAFSSGLHAEPDAPNSISIKPGLWHIAKSNTSTSRMIGSGQDEDFQHCYGSGIYDIDESLESGGCTVMNFEAAPDEALEESVAFDMSCKKMGVRLSGNGTYDTTNDNLNGLLNLRVEGGIGSGFLGKQDNGEGHEIVTMVRGQWLGECPAQDTVKAGN